MTSRPEDQVNMSSAPDPAWPGLPSELQNNDSLDKTPPQSPTASAPVPMTPLQPLVQPRTAVKDTPLRKTANSSGSQMGHSTVAEQKPLLREELGQHTIFDSRLTTDAFQDFTDDKKEKIRRFVADLPKVTTNDALVDWGIPQRPRIKEVDLYTPIKTAIEKIICHFGLTNHRAVLDTHGSQMAHIEGQNLTSIFRSPMTSRATTGATTDEGTDAPPSSRPKRNLYSSPDICIQAVVDKPKDKNNFPYLPEDKRKTYQLCVSPIEVKTERHFPGDSTIIQQIAVYARQIFISQGNRRFVNCFVLTEKHMRLYVFARDGLHHSDKFDIHEYPDCFVRYILGAASLDGNVVGFDSSVYWENGKRYIDVSQCTPNLGILRLVEPDPVFDRSTIRGRGTTCWKAEPDETNSEANGESYLIKDSWRHPERQAETELLKEVVGLDGVGQMAACNDSVTTIAQMRKIDKKNMSDNVREGLKDMILSRIVMDCYGRTLQAFGSRLQLVQAFHDIVVGYSNLFLKAGVLHRDISDSNVLLGKPGASEGNRGIIIDLDMAIRLDRNKSLNGKDQITGTRAFQSLHILMHYNTRIKGVAPHNFMDDLESLFYVLYWVCASYSSPGVLVDELPESLTLWENISPTVAAAAKALMYGTGLEKYFNLSDYYNGAVYDLLKGLFQIFKDRYDKEKYHYEDSEAEGIFKQILDLCREAIRKLPEKETEDTSSTANSQPSEKRPSTLSPDEQRPRKRSRSGTRQAPLA